MNTNIRILLVDDHQIIRQGLQSMLAEEPDFEVVGEASDGRQAAEMVEKLSPDVIIMDLQMPLLNGIDATRQLVDRKLGVKIICLSAHLDRNMVQAALKAGASGYVVKTAAYEQLAEAIHAVMRDKVYLGPEVAGHMAYGMVNVEHIMPAALSGREREVVQLMAEGLSTKQIASQLHISGKTVETHRRNVMQKLNIDSVAELTKYAVREGISAL